MWVEFVLGSCPCSERFFSGYSGFPLSWKTNISKFQFDPELEGRRFVSPKLLGVTLVKQSWLVDWLIYLQYADLRLMNIHYVTSVERESNPWPSKTKTADLMKGERGPMSWAPRSANDLSVWKFSKDALQDENAVFVGFSVLHLRPQAQIFVRSLLIISNTSPRT